MVGRGVFDPLALVAVVLLADRDILKVYVGVIYEFLWLMVDINGFTRVRGSTKRSSKKARETEYYANRDDIVV